MNGICPFAIWLPGPESKTGYNGTQKTHAKVGVTVHTMEYESTPEWNDSVTLYNALFSEREASWTFSICKFLPTGTHEDSAILFQHYPVGTVCWAQGYQGNLWLDSIENEGIAPGEFTDPQYALLVKTLKWMKEAQGCPAETPWITGSRQTDLAYHWVGPILFEHNAVPGAPATNCAVFTHGQVDPIRLLEALNEEEDDMPLTAQDRAWVIMYSGGRKLVKGTAPMIYIITHVGKKPFPGGPAEFVTVGFRWEDVITVPDDVLAEIPTLA